MSQSIPPLPQHKSRNRYTDPAATNRIIVWTILLGVAFWPRLWIIGFWIFGRQMGEAFSSWIIPAIGFIILPWTTLLYAWMWGINSDGVTGWEWLVVAIGVLSDIVFWVVGRRSLR